MFNRARLTLQRGERSGLPRRCRRLASMSLIAGLPPTMLLTMAAHESTRFGLFNWDGACGEDNNWHACCESGDQFNNNWDQPPGPECPPFPGPNDDVDTDVATVVIDGRDSNPIQIKSLKSLNSISHSFNRLEIAGTALLTDYTLTTGNLITSGGLTFESLFEWNGGDLEILGTPGIARSVLTLASSGTKQLNQGTLANEGNAAWTGGRIELFNGSRFINRQNFDIKSDAIMGGNEGTLQNDAMLVKKESSGTTSILSSIDYESTGTTRVETGTLEIAGGGQSNGTFNAQKGATMRFNPAGSKTFTLEGDVAIEGDGGFVKGGGGTLQFGFGQHEMPRLSIESGTLLAKAGSQVTIDRLEFLNGTIAGPGRVDANVHFSQGSRLGVDAGLLLVATGESTWSPPSTIVIKNGSTLLIQDTLTAEPGTSRLEFEPAGSTGLTINGTFDIKSSLTIASGIPVAVENQGTLKNSGGLECTFESGVRLLNRPSAFIVGGNINFNGGGVLGGGFNIDQDIRFQGSQEFRIGRSSRFGGNGFAHLNGARLNITGIDSSFERLKITNGTLDGTGKSTVTSAFTWSGGTIARSGATGQLDIEAPQTVIDGTSEKVLDGRTLRLTETSVTSWTGSGDLTLRNGAFLRNAGTLTRSGQVDVQSAGTGNVFENAGTFIINGGTSNDVLSIYMAFNQRGDMRIDSPMLVRLNGGGVCPGQFNLTEISKLEFRDGTYEFSGTQFDAGSASVAVDGATINVTGDAFADVLFTLQRGLIQGDSDLNVEGALVWTGGTMKGTGPDGGGTTTLGSFQIGSSNLQWLTLDGRLITNISIAQWLGANVTASNSAQFRNRGSMTIAHPSNQTFLGDATCEFANQSSVVKDSHPSRTTFDIRFRNTGTVTCRTGVLRFASDYIQTAGRLIFDGGQIDFALATEITGGRIEGTSERGDLVVARLNNQGGSLAPGQSAGLFTITGDYEQDELGTLEIEIGGRMPAIEHDILDVTGEAVLGGILQVSLIDGFDAQPGDSFTFLTASSVVGQFDAVRMPGAKREWVVEYEANSVRLERRDPLATADP